MGPINESNGTRVVFFTTPLVPFFVFRGQALLQRIALGDVILVEY